MALFRRRQGKVWRSARVVKVPKGIVYAGTGRGRGVLFTLVFPRRAPSRGPRALFVAPLITLIADWCRAKTIAIKGASTNKGAPTRGQRGLHPRTRSPGMPPRDAITSARAKVRMSAGPFGGENCRRRQRLHIADSRLVVVVHVAAASRHPMKV